MTRRRCAWSLCALLPLVLATAPANPELRVAVGSSLHDSGMADQIAQAFTAESDCPASMLAAPSARGLRLLASQDVQVALTHSPAMERDFVNQEKGRSRSEFAHNEFVLAGPVTDPVAIRGKDLPGALVRIHDRQAAFISRGDGSGTHAMETHLWRASLGHVPIDQAWYMQAGTHMAAALFVAAQKGAYTLTDSATLARVRQQNPKLEALARNQPPLANVYSAILPAKPTDCAKELVAWLRSPDGRAVLSRDELLRPAP